MISEVVFFNQIKKHRSLDNSSDGAFFSAEKNPGPIIYPFFSDDVSVQVACDACVYAFFSGVF